MQEELRRSNTVADTKGLLFFTSIVLDANGVNRDSAQQLCALQNNLRIRFDTAVALFEYLGLLVVENGNLFPTIDGKNLYSKTNEVFSFELCKRCLTKAIEDELVDFTAVRFDPETDSILLLSHAFRLDAAVFRNILIQLGGLVERADGAFILPQRFETEFESTQKKARRKLSLESLKNRLERQEEQGKIAEEFVLHYEQQRLAKTAKATCVKRISDFDVTAGYDIVSFDSGVSAQYDRFIEVKSYADTLHFHWSKNEIDVATLLADKYFLYLVDVRKITKVGFAPIIIANPAKTILCTEDWLLKPTSYLVIPTGATVFQSADTSVDFENGEAENGK